MVRPISPHTPPSLSSLELTDTSTSTTSTLGTNAEAASNNTNNATHDATTATLSTQDATQTADAKQEEVFPLELLPTEVILNTLEQLDYKNLIKAFALSRRIDHLARTVLLDPSLSAQHILERCIQQKINSDQLPDTKTLFAIQRGNISEKIFCAWAQTAKTVLPKEATPEETFIKELTQALFDALQKELPGPLVQLILNGKLNTKQWQSWLDSARDSYVESLARPRTNPFTKPFLFHEKLKAFLLNAIFLKDEGAVGQGAHKSTYQILCALQEGRLNAIQLDKWLHNSDYDLAVIAQLARHITAELNHEQIACLENIVVNEAKISLAAERRINLGNTSYLEKFPDDATLLDTQEETLQERLDAIERALEENISNLDKSSIDFFMQHKVDDWIAAKKKFLNISQANNVAIAIDKLTLQTQTTQQENIFLEQLSHGTWQEKIKRCALEILLSRGITFDKAQTIVKTQNHEACLQKNPIAYLNHLSAITYTGADVIELMYFDFLKCENQLLLAVLSNIRGDNPWQLHVLKTPVQWKQLKQICLRLSSIQKYLSSENAQRNSHQAALEGNINRDITSRATKYFYNILYVLKNYAHVMGLAKLTNVLVNESMGFFEITKSLAKFAHDSKAVIALTQLEQTMGPQFFSWMNFPEEKTSLSPKDSTSLSLPFAMQKAYDLGIDLKDFTKKRIQDPQYKNHKNVFAVMCQLFGSRLHEYGHVVEHAIKRNLLKPQELVQHFFLPSGFFCETQNTKKFCSHVLPRLLNHEITFQAFIKPLDDLNKLFKKIDLSIHTRNICIQLYCQGVPPHELKELISKFETQLLLTNAQIVVALMNGTITLTKILSWFKQTPPITTKHIKDFYKVFAYVEAGLISLETLESWMKNKAAQPDTPLYALFDASLFESLIIKKLMKAHAKNDDLLDLDPVEVSAAHQHYAALQAKNEIQTKAKNIDRFIDIAVNTHP